METNVDGDPVRLRTILGKFREDQVAPKLRDVLVMGTTDKVVLTTDWANQCVKAFYRRRERDCLLEVGGKPWCLARISDSQVAVSLPMSSQICLLKVLPRLALQSSFFAQKRYSGLAALSPDTLVASGGGDPPCVDIISLGGDVLRSFSRDAATGRDLFSYPGYITTTPGKKQHFLVSDRRRSALVCLDTSGHVVFSFRPDGGKGLRDPSGVRTDRAGRVYVAESRGVVRLTPEGTLDRPLLRAQDGVEDPRGLALDEEGLLYVTSGEDSITVFRVS
nr:hypothetical protein BaRGS_013407 [Batillaria attramentaria]